MEGITCEKEKGGGWEIKKKIQKKSIIQALSLQS